MAKRAVELQPIDHRAWTMPGAMTNLAHVQAQAGDTADAIVTLDKLLSMPAGLDMSVNELRISPDWDTIRNDARFKALLEKYAGGG